VASSRVSLSTPDPRLGCQSSFTSPTWVRSVTLGFDPTIPASDAVVCVVYSSCHAGEGCITPRQAQDKKEVTSDSFATVPCTISTECLSGCKYTSGCLCFSAVHPTNARYNLKLPLRKWRRAGGEAQGKAEALG